VTDEPLPNNVEAVSSAPALDHIVFAGPDLEAAVALVTDLLGVRPAAGGRHDQAGTANYLLGLGAGAYLEIIGPDPRQPEPPSGRWFGIDTLTTPRVVTWAVRTPFIDQLSAAARTRGHDPGTPRAMSRQSPAGDLLSWRLTPPMHIDGLVPFLIDWDDTPHPTTRAIPQVRLVSWSGTHPSPRPLRDAIAALNCDLEIVTGHEARLTAVIEGRSGTITLT
jgi:catechol 2,3-dioxygenase-like lactoylglutathione lyase family enzyme